MERDVTVLIRQCTYSDQPRETLQFLIPECFRPPRYCRSYVLDWEGGSFRLYSESGESQNEGMAPKKIITMILYVSVWVKAGNKTRE
jgi:hypothetical protein